MNVKGGYILYRIGEFSKITGVSVRTLRYYDEIDLFKPIEIDLFTSYRYYSEEQIEDLNIINDLKNCGFSLDEIKLYWNHFSNDVMLEKKKQLLKEIDDVEQKIRRLDYLRNNIVNGKFCYKERIQMVKSKSLFN